MFVAPVLCCSQNKKYSHLNMVWHRRTYMWPTTAQIQWLFACIAICILILPVSMLGIGGTTSIRLVLAGFSFPATLYLKMCTVLFLGIANIILLVRFWHLLLYCSIRAEHLSGWSSLSSRSSYLGRGPAWSQVYIRTSIFSLDRADIHVLTYTFLPSFVFFNFSLRIW